MQCTEARQKLTQAGAAGFHTVAADLREHLTGCADCLAIAQDLQFRAMLGDRPVPGPSAGFADRALAHAWSVRAGRKAAVPGVAKAAWAVAAAAVLVLGIGMVGRVTAPVSAPASGSGAEVAVVSVAPNAVHEVALLMVSARALDEATITLLLDPNVALAGYPGRSSLTWGTAIAAGNNQLTLPLQLMDAGSGTVTVAVESGGARKEMVFTVQANARQALALLTI